MAFFDWLRRAKPSESKKEKIIPYDIDTWKYRSFDASILEMDLIRASVDALARNIAKMDLSVEYISSGKVLADHGSDVARVLKKPNKYMTQYDFMYKVAAMYYTSNNVFIWPEYDQTGKLIALWPINYKDFHLLEVNGILVAQFQISYTRTYTVPYRQLIHLRNHFMNDDMMGEPNTALKPVTELLNAQNQGIINGIKNSAIIRGILKSVSVIKDEDLAKARDQFVKDNLSASNNGGVIVVDKKFDYSSIDSKPYIIDADTMTQAKSKVFNYFGVNEAFVQNTFTADQYEAVYEGRLEPFAKMFEDAVTDGLFTERERGFGNRVLVQMEKLRYQTISTITTLISVTNQLGLFTRNEYRAMIGFEPLPEGMGGDEIMTSLNYTKDQNLDSVQDTKKEEDEADAEEQ